ncbi:uncharacterized protein LOC136096090 [Hydra vulgaris]|uniref:uncharacterized protein LOC136096090 n=1 Tax=Hydra vulgaris TaxID=6087 RepID=UPI0032EA0E71
MHNLCTEYPNLSLRPIVSSIGTYNYQLANFLRDLLSPIISSEFCSKDSFSFVKDVNQANIHGKYFVSYDVTRLYTNVPLQETIDIAVNLILSNNVNFKINKTDLKKLFIFTTSQSHFSFKKQNFDQTDGVAMGSPVAPVLANLFMGHFEKKWLKSYNGVKPVFYRRYADDIFATFQSENNACHFLGYIN